MAIVPCSAPYTAASPHFPTPHPICSLSFHPVTTLWLSTTTIWLQGLWGNQMQGLRLFNWNIHRSPRGCNFKPGGAGSKGRHMQISTETTIPWKDLCFMGYTLWWWSLDHVMLYWTVGGPMQGKSLNPYTKSSWKILRRWRRLVPFRVLSNAGISRIVWSGFQGCSHWPLFPGIWNMNIWAKDVFSW